MMIERKQQKREIVASLYINILILLSCHLVYEKRYERKGLCSVRAKARVLKVTRYQRLVFIASLS